MCGRLLPWTFESGQGGWNVFLSLGESEMEEKLHRLQEASQLPYSLDQNSTHRLLGFLQSNLDP